MTSFNALESESTLASTTSESNNELNNFAQSFVYSAVLRPAAAVTQMVDSLVPNALPHLELQPPPSTHSVGGFIGETAGNILDMAILARFSGAPKFLGAFAPGVQAAEVLAVNSLLTPVKLPEGENLWSYKLNDAAISGLLGGFTRFALGKGLPNTSQLQVDASFYGIRGVGDALRNTYMPGDYSVYKQTGA